MLKLPASKRRFKKWPSAYASASQHDLLSKLRILREAGVLEVRDQLPTALMATCWDVLVGSVSIARLR